MRLLFTALFSDCQGQIKVIGTNGTIKMCPQDRLAGRQASKRAHISSDKSDWPTLNAADRELAQSPSDLFFAPRLDSKRSLLALCQQPDVRDKSGRFRGNLPSVGGRLDSKPPSSRSLLRGVKKKSAPRPFKAGIYRRPVMHATPLGPQL